MVGGHLRCELELRGWLTKYSKETSYALVETLQRAHAYDSTAAAELVATRDAVRPADWVGEARARLAGADARLAEMRAMYDREVGAGVALSGAVFAGSEGGRGDGAVDEEAEGKGEGGRKRAVKKGKEGR
ncbi:hypothetical protein TSOC_009771 [Tetrabaena socialis]|uniref:Uncharacterized protein n=1 Tax=Tetrabaena socialis TaxID=47790 RepID=A0A2J7ZV17_9CHLO|nr:hypothetical protein TSOC_009771 [Tetrabaena socialis]|eukprot:PNH04099.1 hypothetical protein TSOC_009771 [Tetrabaena socialis]